MKPLRPVVALDIGSTKVACAVGLPQEQGGFELLGTSLLAYPSPGDGWLGDLLMVSRTIEQAIEATAVTADLSHAHVAISHPALISEQVRVSLALGDEPVTIRNQDLQRLQAAAVDRVLGVDREPLHVERLACAGNGFDAVRDPRGLAATRLFGTFHVLTMPLAARLAIVQVVEGAGLEVAGLHSALPAAFASMSDAALSHQQVLVVDLAGHDTTLGLFNDGLLESAAIVAGGGVQVALRIARELQVTMDQAVAWSLQGTACRKAEVRELLAQHWAQVADPLTRLLADRPKPAVALVGGRAALIDGCVEWVERTTGIPVRLCRSPRTQAAQDMTRQVGISVAIGVLELTCRGKGAELGGRFFNRLLQGTRTLLTEYF